MRRVGDGILIGSLLVFAGYLYHVSPARPPISFTKLPLAIAVPVQGLNTGDGPNLFHDNASFASPRWSEEKLFVDPNAAIAPDDTMTAVRLVEKSGFGRHRTVTNLSGVVANQIYTLSLYIKPAERGGMQFEMADFPSGKYGLVQFDLTQKAVMSEKGDTTDVGIEELPKGWYRCWVAMPYTSEAVAFSFDLLTEDGSVTHFGDSNAGILVWGIQFEPGSRPIGYAGPAEQVKMDATPRMH